MQDRVPLYPGRVKLTPVSGQANTYDMTREDQPTQEGTPLNKASLLKDATAALFGLGSDAVPDDVLTTIKNLINTAQNTANTAQNTANTAQNTANTAQNTANAAAKIVNGSYAGTWGGSVSLEFEFTPLLFVVSMQNGPIASIGWVKGVTSGKSITYNYTLLGDATISWEENGITFSDANGNFNASNYTYSYTAIGI